VNNPSSSSIKRTTFSSTSLRNRSAVFRHVSLLSARGIRGTLLLACEGINGTVELDSVVGEGTTFTIKLPLTLAILPSLLASIDGEVFAMPVESVVEIVKITKEEVGSIHGLRTATVRNRVLSVVQLAELFEWSTPRSQHSSHDGGMTLVILGAEDKELALAVDDLLGEEDVVIKSLAENYKNVQGIAGASILGDGRVSLIFDVSALMTLATQTGQLTAI